MSEKRGKLPLTIERESLGKDRKKRKEKVLEKFKGKKEKKKRRKG